MNKDVFVALSLKLLTFWNVVVRLYALFVLMWVLFFAFSEVRTILFGLDPYNPYASGGFGFNLLLPILPMWKLLRNVGYLVTLPAIFIEAGLAFVKGKEADFKNQHIMAVKHTILTMLVLTFSYALAGLAINVLFLAYGLSDWRNQY